MNAGISNTIYDAVLCQKTLRVVYFSKNSNADKTMTIEPLGIVVRDAMTYVICNTDQYDDYIQLALHRFRDVEICGSFVYPVDFDLEQYINSGKLGFSLSDQSINITLRFSSSAGSHLLESPINASQTHTVTDNHITVQTEVFNNKELRWWILGFGDGVEVIEPLELRKEIANTLGTALKLYQQ